MKNKKLQKLIAVIIIYAVIIALFFILNNMFPSGLYYALVFLIFIVPFIIYLTMRNMKLKYFGALSILLVAILFIPLKWPVSFNNLTNNEALVQVQECGCPCPNAKISEGQFTIPDSLATKLKSPITEAYLKNSPYTNIELWDCQLKIKGEIVGASPDYCDSQGCYYYPIINVQSWQTSNYVSWFWTWNVTFGITYLLVTAISVLISLSLLLVKISKHIKSKADNQT